MQIFAPFILKRKHAIIRFTAVVLAVVCMTAMLSQTVFAKNTYVITDGEEVKVYHSYATDPAEVLTQAGIELNADDVYTTQPGDGVSEITVQRAQVITIDNCGEKVETTSYGETLEDLLNRLGIPAHGDYTVSLNMDTQTYDGMEVSIKYIVEAEETYTVDIAYETVYCYDPSLPAGKQEVIVAGALGQMQCKATVGYVNYKEQNRTVLEETVIRQPVTEIVLVGTGAKEDTNSQAPAIGDGVIVTASGEVLTYDSAVQFKTTAYTKTDEGCDDWTATGTYARVGAVAVDPKVVPYGTRMFIVSNDGVYIYGIATAEDCGGGVRGNHIDLYFDTDAECWQYGVRSATVYFLT